MKQTKRQRAQCVAPCELMVGTKQQCEIWRIEYIKSRISSNYVVIGSKVRENVVDKLVQNNNKIYNI